VNIVPHRYTDDSPIISVPMPDGEGLWIECTVTDPPSTVGRTVNLYLSPTDVTELLPELRHSAIATRRKGVPA
jgi:hypothetical protein